nr:peptide-methionine (R)-S-oxide reductase [Panacagrimonas sp.]
MPKLQLSDSEWHALLNPSQFAVLRKGYDERRGSHPLIAETGRGIYICAGCFSPLFESSAKFAHRDYPSFYEANPGALESMVNFGPNTTVGYRCAHCGGYQGQVHNDGPQPTGKRYANNGDGLLFVPRGKQPPPVRTA